jgi:hypothetical protein
MPIFALNRSQNAAGVAARHRDPALDLLKWLALATMVVDHVRILSPDLNWTSAPGRMAFPLFCLIMAVNIGRFSPSDIPSTRSNRYLGWLVAFALISQPIYGAVMNTDLNIFFLLATGYLLALGVRSGGRIGLAHIALGSALTLGLHGKLGYGVAGILLPGAMLLTHTAASPSKRIFWLSSTALLCVATNWPSSPERITELVTLLGFVIAAATPVLGFCMIKLKIPIAIPPVTQWGYFFYPAHILLLGLIISLK